MWIFGTAYCQYLQNLRKGKLILREKGTKTRFYRLWVSPQPIRLTNPNPEIRPDLSPDRTRRQSLKFKPWIWIPSIQDFRYHRPSRCPEPFPDTGSS